MINLILLLSLVTFFGAVFFWAFRNLPAEEWQIMAAVPRRRGDDGTWTGLNLTYYGFFNASACLFSGATIIALMSSIGVPVLATLSITSVLLLFCIPAARIVARIVEKKSATFTVGGASFVGVILLPWLIQAFNVVSASTLGVVVPIVPMLAAVAIAYAFGEAFGRLACISFGCCYGKLLWQTPKRLHKLLARFCFTFSGETKKVAYEANWIERPLLPIQAVTAVVSTLAGIGGVFFFVRSNWTIALALPITITQLWRVISEILRADYRGEGRISAYQLMAIGALVYSLAWISLVDSPRDLRPNVLDGLSALTHTPVLLFLQGFWLVMFLYTGRSSVTASRLSFHVVRERI